MPLKALLHLRHLFPKSNNERISKNMSRHPSFGKATKGAAKRNVLKRFERVDVLKKLGKWSPEENKRVTNLPKTPIIG